MRSPICPTGRPRRSAFPALGLLLALGCGGDPAGLGLARSLQESGDFAGSIAPLRAVLDETPGHPEANHRLGVALLRTGRPSQALWPLRRASRSEAFAGESGLLLTSALLSTGNFEQALAASERVANTDPDRVEVWTLRASAHFRLRQLEPALVELDRALALAPDDLGVLALRAGLLARLEREPEARAAYRDLRGRAERAGEPSVAATACVALAGILPSRDRTPRLDAGPPIDPTTDPTEPPEPPLPDRVADPRTEAAYRDCFDAHPGEPAAVAGLTRYLLAVDDREGALTVWRRAVEAAPDRFALRLGLANQLWLMGQREAAKQSLREAAGELGGSPPWEALAELHRLDGEFASATEALARAEAADRPSEALRFRRAELLIEAGDLEAAGTLAEGFAESGYASLLRGRIALERGDSQRALAAFEAGLARFPGNAVARALAGRAAQESGELDRALSHYLESVRADPRASNAGLAGAQLAHALGRHAEALTFATYYIRSRPYEGPQPYLIGARTARAAGLEATADALLDALAEREGGNVPALAERARLALEAGEPEASAALVLGSEADLREAENDALLRVLVEARIAASQPRDALARLDAALATRPGSAALLAVRGRVLHAMGLEAQARAAYQAALAADPDETGALVGLGVLAHQAGDTTGAIAYLSRAADVDAVAHDAGYRVAQQLLAAGRRSEAEARLRALLRRAPGHAGAANDLAWLLAERREELDRALELAERAARLAPASASLDTLAYVQLQSGDTAAAIATLESALEQHPDDATLRYRLGTARLAAGDTERARASLERALATGPFAEAEQARATLAALGAADPQDPPPGSAAGDEP